MYNGMMVEGGVAEVGGYAGAGNEVADAVKGWLGHTAPEMAMIWNAAVAKPVGAVVPLKAVMAAMAIEGVNAAEAVLAMGATEYTDAFTTIKIEEV